MVVLRRSQDGLCRIAMREQRVDIRCALRPRCGFSIGQASLADHGADGRRLRRLPVQPRRRQQAIVGHRRIIGHQRREPRRKLRGIFGLDERVLALGQDLAGDNVNDQEAARNAPRDLGRQLNRPRPMLRPVCCNDRTLHDHLPLQPPATMIAIIRWSNITA
ncbi:MAG: hypothetical protein MUC44_13760 [Beijerinckiaceae bacterium]|nr:hypothetical protein [Beijerinckiaceae bacterium]